MHKALTGNAGEHYVAFQLSARGYAVGLTARGMWGADLLVANLHTRKSITVQVKTMVEAYTKIKKVGYWKWRVGLSRAPLQATFYYVFLDFKNNLSDSPDAFVVPSVTLESATSTGLLGLFLEVYPTTRTPKTSAWFSIADTPDKGAYYNHWDVITAALGSP